MLAESAQAVNVGAIVFSVERGASWIEVGSFLHHVSMAFVTALSSHLLGKHLFRKLRKARRAQKVRRARASVHKHIAHVAHAVQHGHPFKECPDA